MTDQSIEKEYQVGATIFSVICVVFFMYLVISALPTEPQQNFMKRTSLEEKQFMKIACKTKSVCDQYKDVRKSCAIAGNIDLCIKIKSDDKSYVDLCDSDGEYALPKEVIPNKSQCLKSAWDSIEKIN